jgi:hypothetical protein
MQKPSPRLTRGVSQPAGGEQCRRRVIHHQQVGLDEVDHRAPGPRDTGQRTRVQEAEAHQQFGVADRRRQTGDLADPQRRLQPAQAMPMQQRFRAQQVAHGEHRIVSAFAQRQRDRQQPRQVTVVPAQFPAEKNARHGCDGSGCPNNNGTRRCRCVKAVVKSAGFASSRRGQPGERQSGECEGGRLGHRVADVRAA